MRPVLRWTQRFLFAGATLLLGYCAFVLADTWMFEHQAKQTLEHTTDGPLLPVLSGRSGLLGRIDIARLGISVVVVEGTGEAALQRAAGHIEGTGLPGQLGNLGIAAHRDTFFRPLRNVRRDDVITLTTPGAEYRYRVVSTKIVKPSDVAVLNSDGTEVLTLVTCYPFYFVGSAPRRFIVRAVRITG